MALSSFGFGGANMHAIMDGHRPGQRSQLVTVEAPAQPDSIIPLAARTAQGLQFLANVIIEVHSDAV